MLAASQHLLVKMFNTFSSVKHIKKINALLFPFADLFEGPVPHPGPLFGVERSPSCGPGLFARPGRGLPRKVGDGAGAAGGVHRLRRLHRPQPSPTLQCAHGRAHPPARPAVLRPPPGRGRPRPRRPLPTEYSTPQITKTTLRTCYAAEPLRTPERIPRARPQSAAPPDSANTSSTSRQIYRVLKYENI